MRGNFHKQFVGGDLLFWTGGKFKLFHEVSPLRKGKERKGKERKEKKRKENGNQEKNQPKHHEQHTSPPQSAPPKRSVELFFSHQEDDFQ